MHVHGVDVELLNLLCCPVCRGDVATDPDQPELSCGPCGNVYPIIDGIPVLFPRNVKEEYEQLFNRYWDSEERAATYDRFVEGGDSLIDLHHHIGEIRATMEVLGDSAGKWLLDCGCGNGRFFEEYSPSTHTVGVDASLNLLRICKEKRRCERLVCCELEHLPFRDAVFDLTVSVRVLQHIHEQETAVSEMVRTLIPGGRTIIHCYNSLSSKAFIKRIRESRLAPILNAPFRLVFRSMSPFGPWNIPYDKYSSVRQIRKWLRAHGATVSRVRGSGFGFNKWFLGGFLIAAWLEKNRPALLKRYLNVSMHAEESLGRVAPLNRFMEKFVVGAARRD